MRQFMQIVENADPILYHGTSAPITEPFRPFSHFGTRAAALHRAAVVVRQQGRTWADGVWSNDLDAPVYLYPVTVHMTKPLRLRDLTGKHSGHGPADIARLLPAREFSNDERRAYDYDMLGSIIISHGYDGIVYENSHEDAGSDSTIILRSEQATARAPEIMTLRDALVELGVPETNFHE